MPILTWYLQNALTNKEKTTGEMKQACDIYCMGLIHNEARKLFIVLLRNTTLFVKFSRGKFRYRYLHFIKIFLEIPRWNVLVKVVFQSMQNLMFIILSCSATVKIFLWRKSSRALFCFSVIPLGHEHHLVVPFSSIVLKSWRFSLEPLLTAQ